MPQKRPPRKITKQDVEELEKVTGELKKREVKYPEAGGGELIMKDACKISYPEPTGGELLVKKDSTIDTHRVELKKIRSVPKVKIAGPEDTAKFVRELEDSDRERFVVIWLDTKNRVLGVENVSTGSINQAIVHPREALKGAVLANAAGVIFVHNHPSGIPEPSLEDDELVAKLRDVFKLVGIQVLDAIIIGKEGYYSYLVESRLDRQLTGGGERIMEAREDDRKDYTECKSRAIELGKNISELIIHSTGQPTHSVTEKELEKLRMYLDQLYARCGVSASDQVAINKIYKEIWNAQVLASGEKISSLLQKLSSALFYAQSNQSESIKEGISLYKGIMEGKTAEDDACAVAMRAAMETMGKYCTETNVVEIDGRQYTLPYEVMQIRENGDMTYDQRVKAIMESRWARNEAQGLCALIGEATPECIEKVSKKLAVGMVIKG